MHAHTQMPEAKEDVAESALNMLVSVTEKSGNLRNDLKKDILKAVSTLRKSIVSIKKEVEEKNKIISDLEAKAVEASDTIHVLTEERNNRNVVIHAAPSIGGRGRFFHGGGCTEVPSTGGARYQYADAVMNNFEFIVARRDKQSLNLNSSAKIFIYYKVIVLIVLICVFISFLKVITL